MTKESLYSPKGQACRHRQYANTARRHNAAYGDVEKSRTRNLLKIGLVANTFEFYEFAIYIYWAEVIGRLFFNTADSVSGTLQAFSIFAMGYLARPLGSLFFGIIGDRVGRGKPLRLSLMMMAIPTVLIGLLPTYHEIGVLAPILLLACRLVQGFAMGGELTANGCYLFEAAPTHQKSVLCSLVMVSLVIGTLLASGVTFVLVSYFDRPTIVQWAWRIPFILSIPLTIFIAYMRRNIEDRPVPQTNYSNFNFLRAKRPLIEAASLLSFTCVFAYVLTFWMPFYLMHFLGYSSHDARLTNVLVLIALIPLYVYAGKFSQRFGYRQLIRVGLLGTLFLILPLWFGLKHASLSQLLIVQLLMACLLSCTGGICMEALARIFPPAQRSRSMSVAYTFPAVFLGSTTPLICTWMIEKTQLIMFPACYLMLLAAVALPSAWQRLEEPAHLS